MGEQAERRSRLSACVPVPTVGPADRRSRNSFIIGERAGGHVVVIDPSSEDEAHLRVLVSHGTVDLVLLTHAHEDHASAARKLAEMTGAPVRAADSDACIGGEPLVDGEIIEAGGVRIIALATPGHTSDSMCFLLPDDTGIDDDRVSGSIATGDTILGDGDPVVAYPDGDVRSFMESLARLAALGPLTVLPGIGLSRVDLQSAAKAGRQRHDARLEAVRRAALDVMGPSGLAPVTVEQVAGIVDPQSDAALQSVAENVVAAQLAYLTRRPA